MKSADSTLTKSAASSGLSLLVAGLGIGIANAVVLFLFEFVGVDGTAWLWNDVLHTDTNRWRVLPVAVVGGLAMAAAFRIFNTKRLVSPEADLMQEMNSAPSTLGGLWTVLAIGAVCLLAGGSIGPEASLMTASAAIASIVALRWKFGSTKQLLVLSSIGALLVAFIGSPVLILIPLLLLFKMQKQQGKKLTLQPLLIIILTGLASLVTIRLIHHFTESDAGFTAPVMPKFTVHDFIVAAIVGFAASLVSVALVRLIRYSYHIAQWFNAKKLPASEWIMGAGFGLVLGLIYLLGGQSVEFSGDVGSKLLVSTASQYGALALLGLIIAKLLATAWSKGTGYRGGLVFPSIYMGIALGLFVGQLIPGAGGAGALIGGIAGIMVASMGSPLLGGIFLIAILPWRLWPVAACAIIGTMVFDKVSKKLERS